MSEAPDSSEVLQVVKRKRFQPQTSVLMLRDVGGKFEDGVHRWSLSAGQKYWLDAEKADEFIIKGYAQGNLSRDYSEDEMAFIRSSMQTITLPREVLSDG